MLYAVKDLEKNFILLVLISHISLYKMPKNKRIVSGPFKRVRRKEASTEGPSIHADLTAPMFATPRFQKRYNRLRMKRVGQTCTIDWQVLEHFGQATKVRCLADVGGETGSYSSRRLSTVRSL